MISNANQAVARIAYKTNEICVLYPITPATEMGELAEQWSTESKENIFGDIPDSFQMQSEAGVAGAMHGALQTGSLTTTFTASQGLLLMMPNMYKIAGQLIPNVIHVATRSIATHALSVFGDHSDIMAVRSTGYAFLGSASVQEAQDFALIAQAASLKSRIPFVHFFDGFRTSHEVSTIQGIPDSTIRAMLPEKAISLHKARALQPDAPVVRGTAQGPEIFFQGREAVNSQYQACPDIVQKEMNSFSRLTGRQYRLFDYAGHPEATHIMVTMASSAETVEKTVEYLNRKGGKYGLIKVRLFRPFSTKHLLQALPKTVQAIAVLDRTKEPGASGEPLYLDVVQTLQHAYNTKQRHEIPKIIGGRYGLSSKEFTPAMVAAVFKNLEKTDPVHSFTVGITDDVTGLSLPLSRIKYPEYGTTQVIFYEKKSETASKGFRALLGALSASENYVQGYERCGYKKSGNTLSKMHLRFGNTPVKAPYLISEADIVLCEAPQLLAHTQMLSKLTSGGTLMVAWKQDSKWLWESLPNEIQSEIKNRKIHLKTLNPEKVQDVFSTDPSTYTDLQMGFLALMKAGRSKEHHRLRECIRTVDTSMPGRGQARQEHRSGAQSLTEALLNGRGNELPVSSFPVDGTYETDTSKFHHICGDRLPVWNPEACIQCGACSMACPQGALRIKAFDNSYMAGMPLAFKSVNATEIGEETNLQYGIQVNPDQCSGCTNCEDACPVEALTMVVRQEAYHTQQKNWYAFKEIPEYDSTKINDHKIREQQLQEPLFKYPVGVDGCGEAPYLKLISQLFGERLLIANATGSSSIFGGALPGIPWSKNSKGRGPAWANSLFEDNAEFGLGFRLSLDKQERKARKLISDMSTQLGKVLVEDVLNARQESEKAINAQRNRIAAIEKKLRLLDSDKARQLEACIQSLVKKSVWIVGGDGWAYDIGFGGLDHAMASGRNINILVLDNQVYDNTGGQTSKATPFGAQAGFSYGGKRKLRKDLGLMAMSYEDVYVASVAIGADQEQTLKAFKEAEAFPGPSLILAYCHSQSHGIDMKKPSAHHKAVVASGQWLLYRHNPMRLLHGETALKLDSGVPELPLETYLQKEKRFHKFLKQQKSTETPVLKALQQKTDLRFNAYKTIAAEVISVEVKL